MEGRAPGDRVAVGVAVAEAEPVPETVPELEGVLEGEAPKEREVVGVPLPEGVPVPEVLGVPVPVPLLVGVPEGVMLGVGVTLGVTLGETVPLGVGEASVHTSALSTRAAVSATSSRPPVGEAATPRGPVRAPSPRVLTPPTPVLTARMAPAEPVPASATSSSPVAVKDRRKGEAKVALAVPRPSNRPELPLPAREVRCVPLGERRRTRVASAISSAPVAFSRARPRGEKSVALAAAPSMLPGKPVPSRVETSAGPPLVRAMRRIL